MKTNVLVLLTILGLSGCDATTQDVSRNFQLPEELKDCHIIELRPDGGDSTRIHLIKCPEGYLNSHTVFQQGKTQASSTVIML